MPDPFPLNIASKQDSFEKLQLLANVDSSFKYDAEEFNKIIEALEWLRNHSGPQSYQGLVQNSYLTIAELLANQTDQTSGHVQFVADASDDLRVDDGYAYYEKLIGSAGNLLNDYRKLSQEETEFIVNSTPFLQLKTQEVTVANIIQTSGISFGYSDVEDESENKIIYIVFNQEFKQKIIKYEPQVSNKNLYIQLWNFTQKAGFYAKVIDWFYADDNEEYIGIQVEPTVHKDSFAVKDDVNIDFFFTENGVQTVTGDLVDNTDPQNPVIIRENLIDSGDILPTVNLFIGMYFKLDLLNRSILYQYDGMVWTPIRSFGAMSIWVNESLGSDEYEKGDDEGTEAFETIEFAISQIPPQFYGDVNVFIQEGNYTESIYVGGKVSIGDYKIKITGEVDVVSNGTTTSISYHATNGSLTYTDNSKSWTINEHQNKLILITSGVNEGCVIPILSNTANAIKCVSYNERAYRIDLYENDLVNVFSLDTVNCNYEILETKTFIEGLICSSSFYSLNMQFLNFSIIEQTSAYGSPFYGGCVFFIDTANARVIMRENCTMTVTSSVFYNTGSTYALIQLNNGNVDLSSCILKAVAIGKYSILAGQGSSVIIKGSFVTGGVLISAGSSGTAGWNVATMVNCDNTIVQGVSNSQRFNNTVNSMGTINIDTATFSVNVD